LGALLALGSRRLSVRGAVAVQGDRASMGRGARIHAKTASFDQSVASRLSQAVTKINGENDA
jgi:hypothetical protein